jgi:hypothetical protein
MQRGALRRRRQRSEAAKTKRQTRCDRRELAPRRSGCVFASRLSVASPRAL